MRRQNEKAARIGRLLYRVGILVILQPNGPLRSACSKAPVTCFGPFLIISHIFLFEKTQGLIQSRIENLWIRVDDYQSTALTKHLAFMKVVSATGKFTSRPAFWTKNYYPCISEMVVSTYGYSKRLHRRDLHIGTS